MILEFWSSDGVDQLGFTSPIGLSYLEAENACCIPSNTAYSVLVNNERQNVILPIGKGMVAKDGTIELWLS
jgi:hypothetical protein